MFKAGDVVVAEKSISESPCDGFPEFQLCVYGQELIIKKVNVDGSRFKYDVQDIEEKYGVFGVYSSEIKLKD